MIRKQSTDPIFDPVSIRLSDAAHINEPKICLFLKNTNFRWAFDVNVVRRLYFLIAPETGQFPQKISFNE